MIRLNIPRTATSTLRVYQFRTSALIMPIPTDSNSTPLRERPRIALADTNAGTTVALGGVPRTCVDAPGNASLFLVGLVM
jgi:hypothetical protein